MVIALFGGAAWVLQFAPHFRWVPYLWLHQWLLLAAGSIVTYWLIRLTACGLIEISKDQLVRRLALVFATVVMWSHFTILFATRPDIQLDGIGAAIGAVIVFGIYLVLSYLFVGFTVARLKP
jgi:hypothetical protein